MLFVDEFLLTVLVPDYGKCHRNAEESVFDEGILGESDFFTQGTEFVLRKKGHIVTSRPSFA